MKFNISSGIVKFITSGVYLQRVNSGLEITIPTGKVQTMAEKRSFASAIFDTGSFAFIS